MNEETTVYFSKFAFIFLIYVVISSGYISQILSCQMQNFLTNNFIGRHIIGIVMVFVFIMLEGGWSLQGKDDKESENNWSTGNVIDSLIISIGIYVIFLISSKSQLIPNIIFYILLFILYAINTQRSFWLSRNKITEDTNTNIIHVEIGLFITTLLTLCYGFIDYILYQKQNYKNNFSWSTFILGKTKCSSVDT